MARTPAPQRPAPDRRWALRPRVLTLSSPVVRYASQVGLVVLLFVAWGMFTGRIDSLLTDNEREKATTQTISEMLAKTCEVASPAELRRQGLVAECRLARTGKIDQAVPEAALPTKAGQPAVADVIPDSSNDTAPSAGDSAIARAVDGWFATHDLRLALGYEESLRTAVAKALAANPPQRGPRGRGPTTAQIDAAVTAALVADPPPAGQDGADGRGLTSASLDGCTLNLVYTDGTATAIGPICGPQGPGPSDSDIAAAVADYCAANGNCRGPQGPAGYPDSFTTADGQRCTDPDGDHDYTCTLDGPVGQPSPSGSPDPTPSPSSDPSASPSALSGLRISTR